MISNNNWIPIIKRKTLLIINFLAPIKDEIVIFAFIMPNDMQRKF